MDRAHRMRRPGKAGSYWKFRAGVLPLIVGSYRCFLSIGLDRKSDRFARQATHARSGSVRNQPALHVGPLAAIGTLTPAAMGDATRTAADGAGSRGEQQAP